MHRKKILWLLGGLACLCGTGTLVWGIIKGTSLFNLFSTVTMFLLTGATVIEGFKNTHMNLVVPADEHADMNAHGSTTQIVARGTRGPDARQALHRSVELEREEAQLDTSEQDDLYRLDQQVGNVMENVMAGRTLATQRGPRPPISMQTWEE